MNKELIERYADLIVVAGANVQKGQKVVIRTEVSQEYLAEIVARKCYEHGASRVFIHWQSAKLSKVDMLHAEKEELMHNTPFELEAHKYIAEEAPILIWLDADDPDAFNGIDQKKYADIRASKSREVFKYRQMVENKRQWVIAGCPSKEWAKKVFPDLSEEEAFEKLWEAILLTSRAADGNGIENWKNHEKDLKSRCEFLNSLNLRSLHYTSSNGTDLTVGLIPGVIFLGGGEATLSGVFFQPNIPSEECFTTPMRGKAEGIVYSAKPLAYAGQLIENFWVRFHEGKAIEVGAEKGEEALRGILSIDEGSAYLGECALVPFDSPINNTGILFYNTLYDENASCHLALGRGFTNLYPDFDKYMDKELESFGINSSTSHVDFMIGSKDLSIVGIDKDGKEIQIFKDGNWAF